MPATLYLFVGYPGAGKTTIANYIADKTGAVHLWTDRIRQDLFGQRTYSQDESDQLYQELNQQTRYLLSSGKSVIYDTNFNYLKDRQLLREIANASRAYCILIWVNTPKEVAKKRALHTDHRDRNNYSWVMSEEEFERIASHLEQPTASEQPLCFDGTNIDYDLLSSRLGL